MYLLKLYRYNKWLFAAIVFFAAMQLLVTYKRGMVISPWYNYGMYSGRMYMQPGYRVNKIGPLKGNDFGPQAWDKIHYTLQQWQALPQNDSLFEKEIKRIFEKLHLQMPDRKQYVSHLPPHAFTTFFFNYLPALRYLPEKDKRIDSATYTWNNRVLRKRNPELH